MSPIKIWSGIPAIRNLIQLVKMMSTGGGCQLLRFSRPRASYIFREIRRWKAGNPDQMMDNYRFICSSSWNCPVYALTLSELKRTHECWYYEISMRTHLLILTHSACSFDHVSQMCSFSRDELLPSSRFDFEFPRQAYKPRANVPPRSLFCGYQWKRWDVKYDSHRLKILKRKCQNKSS